MFFVCFVKRIQTIVVELRQTEKKFETKIEKKFKKKKSKKKKRIIFFGKKNFVRKKPFSERFLDKLG